ncbi:HIT family protein [Ammoniphilus sp. 3BR4]|uniref:HIT family protein n=1 Tax=Ammoniphilus sp. 3BR4 TaxID=3158265 RepID=UPI003467CF18
MSCPFCSIPKEQLILENELAQGFYDKYPVQKGHLLIVPKRHAETYFDATPEEILAIHQLIRQGKEMMDHAYHPDGYNIGVNVGEYGGQTVMHLHFHLIPRYKGDIEDPRGGIRKAIPNLVPYP